MPGRRVHGRAVLQVAANGRRSISDDPGDAATAPRIVSMMLITAGSSSSPTSALTLVWQEPLSAVYGSIEQGQAEDQLDDARATQFSRTRRRRPGGDRRRRRQRARRREHPRRPLRAAPRRRASRSAASRSPRSASTSSSSRAPTPPRCRRAPATTRNTPLPGPARTVAIAGHRTTYLAPRSATSTRSRTATRSASRCRTRRSPTTSSDTRSSTRADVGIVKPRRLRAARADGLPPALQRRPALRRLRRPEADRPRCALERRR